MVFFFFFKYTKNVFQQPRVWQIEEELQDNLVLPLHRAGLEPTNLAQSLNFSGLCSSSVTAALALMTVITQLLLMDKINFTN